MGIQIEATARVGIVRPMLAIAEPSARLSEVWMRSRRAALTAAIVSGSSTSSAMTTPTNDTGRPTASTPSSMAGDSILASPTTATSESSRKPSETVASRVVGGSACSSSVSVPALARHGQEEVAVAHGLGHDERQVEGERGDGGEGELPGGELRAGLASVTVGSTRQSVARVATVASAPPVPSALNRTVLNRVAPISRDSPRMPLT